MALFSFAQMAAPSIQFDDSILPVGQGQRVASTQKISSTYEKHHTELDDEEHARQIADVDLQGSRKQVSRIHIPAVFPT